MPVAPGVPVAVHLMTEAQDDWTTERAHRLRVGIQVAVVLPGCDQGEADAKRVDLHERHRTVLSRRRSEIDPEGLAPRAVIHDHIRSDPRGCRESCHPGVRRRDAALVYAEIRN